MSEYKWFLADRHSPPQNRKFLAILSATMINTVAILHWSNMDDCFYFSPVSRPDRKIYETDIVYWREIPTLPPEYQGML